MADPDRETRDRLLDVAAHLFAERGFENVTIRDICQQARANVAAVNYHFDGKSGLYDEVLRWAISIMQATTQEIRDAGEGKSPAERLEASIRVFLARVASTRNKWIHELMLQEVSHPTPAFDLVLEQVLKPRMAYVREAIAGILGCDREDERVGLCVMSVQSQLFALMKSPIATRLGQPQLTPEHAEQLARHIACFSIGGIHAVGSNNDRSA
jgi:AcrR family transcriptional regulator